MQGRDEFARPKCQLDCWKLKGRFTSVAAILAQPDFAVSQNKDERRIRSRSAGAFMRKAWRRPVVAPEIDAKLALYDRVKAEKPSFLEAIKVAADLGLGFAELPLSQRTRRARQWAAANLDAMNWPRVSRTSCGAPHPMPNYRSWPMPGHAEKTGNAGRTDHPPAGRRAQRRVRAQFRRGSGSACAKLAPTRLRPTISTIRPALGNQHRRRIAGVFRRNPAPRPARYEFHQKPIS